MVFASPIFVFLFLPIVLALTCLARPPLRNGILLVASLFFAAWGDPRLVWVMLAATLVNHGFGLAIGRGGERSGLLLTLAVVLNLGLLGYFKYADFFAANLSLLGLEVSLRRAGMPLGISFYTFHSLSYLIDIHRKKCQPQRNLFSLALYISFFPKLMAGPIVRYCDLQDQLSSRATSLEKLTSGVQRFILGLAKKLLIANTLGAVVDQIFALPESQLTPGLAWLGAIGYTLQIYYDFSGYSDMAIGLARLFGFDFLENFDFPYFASSVRDFWRRWHISLSSWFRDYLYIPLGGNRVGPARQHINLVTVFFLCGLWHGASWTFVFWGLFHGAFLTLERTRFGALLDRSPRPFRHAYTLLVVVVGWVFFRAERFDQALWFLARMVGLGGPVRGSYSLAMFATPEILFTIAVAVLFSWPLPRISRLLTAPPAGVRREALLNGALLVVFFLAILRLIGSTHNPFIYFRF